MKALVAVNKFGSRKHPPSFKAKVALEALRGAQTTSQIASSFGVHATQIERWKKVALTRLIELFDGPGDSRTADKDALIATLYQEVGQLKVELDWLEKKVG